MNVHKNTKQTPLGREQRVLSGHTPEAAARDAGVCVATVCKWVARYKAEGAEGLKDRSSLDEWPSRKNEPDAQRSDRQAISLFIA